jgi:hypothetical protein
MNEPWHGCQVGPNKSVTALWRKDEGRRCLPMSRHSQSQAVPSPWWSKYGRPECALITLAVGIVASAVFFRRDAGS